MTALRFVLPHPLTSLLLLLVWLVLQRSVSPGHLLLGGALAVVVPLFTRRFWPERVPVGSPRTVLKFLAVVAWDILVANLSVARITLGPDSALSPGFARLKLRLSNDFAVTVLANTISLTPGTVSAELSQDRAYLIVHYLSCESEDALLRDIQERYEAPLMEIFK